MPSTCLLGIVSPLSPSQQLNTSGQKVKVSTTKPSQHRHNTTTTANLPPLALALQNLPYNFLYFKSHQTKSCFYFSTMSIISSAPQEINNHGHTSNSRNSPVDPNNPNNTPSPPFTTQPTLSANNFVSHRRSMDSLVTPQMRKQVAYNNNDYFHSTDSRSKNLQNIYLPKVPEGISTACRALNLSLAEEDKQWLNDHCGRFQYYIPKDGLKWKSLMQSQQFKNYFDSPILKII